MATVMPDIANSSQAQTQGTLDWVGMSHIEMPLVVSLDGQTALTVSAKISAYVSLDDAKAKGIHMSRLYIRLDQLSTEQELNFATLQQVLEDFAESHNDISRKARVRFEFDYHLRRPSLKSANTGWKAYPLCIDAQLEQGELDVELSLSVPYSSTCPCSAALARQLIQQAFNQQFAGQEQVDAEQVHQWLGSRQGIVATPHSQRSVAQVKVKLSAGQQTLPFVELIEQLEDTLKTPVQAAVKREDEQEFALLNGQNLMFCEDAARRLKHSLNQRDDLADFWLRVDHLESLHAHDAVAIAVKGVAEGYQP